MRSNRALFAALLAVFGMASMAQASTPVWSTGPDPVESRVGAGISLGQTMGFSGKYIERRDAAVDFGAGYSWDGYFVLNADYLFQFPALLRAAPGFLSGLVAYAGGGAEYSYSTRESKAGKTIVEALVDRDVWGGIGARFPLGVEWVSPSRAAGVFAEFVPGLGFAPETYLILRGGAGIRWYF